MEYDQLNRDKYFFSDDLFFCACALIEGVSKVELVLPHPDKPGMKMFGLTPVWETQRLYKDYLSDKLSVNPTILNSKMAQLKRLPIDEETQK